VGDFISESGAISFRNRGRLNIGMVGDFARNHHQCGCLGPRRPHPHPHATTRKSLKSNEKHYESDSKARNGIKLKNPASAAMVRVEDDRRASSRDVRSSGGGNGGAGFIPAQSPARSLTPRRRSTKPVPNSKATGEYS
jgi:hypothetical protein